MRVNTLIAILLISASPAVAGELAIMPPQTVLTGPRASQQLRVVQTDKARVTADATDAAKFASSNPAVATVDEAGLVQAVGDGEAMLTAMVNNRKATATIKVTGSKTPPPPSFRNEVIPIMTRLGCNSGACHGALAGKGGLKLSLRGYDPEADHFAITRQAFGRRVDLAEPARSLFLLKPTSAMPHGGGQRLEVDSTDHQRIVAWLRAGAVEPKPTDAVVTRLEVFPTAATLAVDAKLRVLARAHYSDGRMLEVTRWAKFSSTEELVAGVDEAGQVGVKGHGEAAINVQFGSHVATVPIASPYPAGDKVTKLLTAAERRNFIDDHVLAKLRTLNIPPSPLCTDAEFIRRVHLDTAGILPSPEEVQKFVADGSPDKRAKLIEQLLERPEFIDYWTYKWADLLLVSTRKLPQPAVWAFHQFIRQSVADNKPWDRFAREIITASGSNLHHGAGSYFVLHKDTAELAEATSVTFMGMSITCCRCHNHPLEKWTQDQYWSYANLFSRVGLKNGDRGGEVLVQSQPAGDALHLRRGIAMPPTPLDGKPLAADSTLDRRAYFADWLTAPDNPYFAKAIVNRVWRNFLGRGLVEAEDDLRQTNPPSNAALLDALVRDFVSPTADAKPYDLKRLMRTILNSVTYQRSSTPLPENAADDRFGSHYLIRRLPAEVVLDAYAQLTGVPTTFNQLQVGTTGGTAGTNNYPLGTRALQLPDAQVVSIFLDAFGRPDREQTCACERQQDSSVSQALHLNNGQTLNDKLRDKKSVVERWVADKVADEEAIRRLFQMALCRAPTPAEQAKLQQLMKDAAADPASSRREALEDLFWAVLTGREFLFNR
jgi:hypothetical protein